MVRVPVLSTTTVSTFCSRSRASAFLTSTPSLAPRPTPTMIDIGVARPSAHGQAMISTLTAATIANGSRGCGPIASHNPKVARATAITTGTNTAEILSTSPWIGARDRCAWETRSTIRARVESAPRPVASTTRLPPWMIVPPMTRSPGLLSTGTGSPVIIDSSTYA